MLALDAPPSQLERDAPIAGDCVGALGWGRSYWQPARSTAKRELFLEPWMRKGTTCLFHLSAGFKPWSAPSLPRPASNTIGQGYTLSEALGIRDRLAPHAGRIWWGMCLTGMNPKEFWGDWTVHPGERIHVAGTKREGRVRDVPLVDLPTRPELTRAGFRSALQRLDRTVTPKLARKTFDRWMQDAGIPACAASDISATGSAT